MAITGNKHPKFITLNLIFSVRTFFQEQKKIEKIYMDFEKLKII